MSNVPSDKNYKMNTDPNRRFTPASEIIQDWIQGMKEDTQQLINPPKREPMYKSDNPNQEQRWKDNVR